MLAILTRAPKCVLEISSFFLWRAPSVELTIAMPPPLPAAAPPVALGDEDAGEPEEIPAVVGEAPLFTNVAGGRFHR